MTKNPKHDRYYLIKSFIAGGVAGCTAKTIIAPLDRIKILFQTLHPPYTSYAGSLKGIGVAGNKIYQETGIKGLLQGHSMTLARIFPYAAIKFMAYEQFSIYLMPREEDVTHFRRFLAGSLAGVTAVTTTYPLDLLRVHIALNPDASWRTIPYFYRGFLPTFIGMIPYAGVSFLTYETLASYVKSKHKFTALDQLLCGGMSGAIAQTASYPLEVVRRRIQVSTQPNPTILTTILEIHSRYGFKGFFIGLSIGYIKVVPMFATSFVTYETTKRILKI